MSEIEKMHSPLTEETQSVVLITCIFHSINEDDIKTSLAFTVSSDNLMVFTEDTFYSNEDFKDDTKSYKLKHSTDTSDTIDSNWGNAIALGVK